MAARFREAMDSCAALKAGGAFVVLDRDRVVLEGDCGTVAGAESDVAADAVGIATLGVAGGKAALILPGEDIAKHLEGAAGVALLAVTLGHESERLIRRETALSATDGMLVDAAASSMAEVAVCELHERLRSWAAAQGLHVGPRFSPGYGDLPLSVQPAILAQLNATRMLGMSTTDAYMLVPAKSITAIVGLFVDECEDEALPSDSRSCEECTMADVCLLRKQGRTCRGGRSE
ncbi:MAG: vitamin B12 dependent methionine synthase [Eggerthellaceae bacterium]|nr:vitamin B12 dependent methionine synthase [Eggerthellaceae bacterium]